MDPYPFQGAFTNSHTLHPGAVTRNFTTVTPYEPSGCQLGSVFTSITHTSQNSSLAIDTNFKPRLSIIISYRLRHSFVVYVEHNLHNDCFFWVHVNHNLNESTMRSE